MMTESLWPIFILNIGINSFLSFFTLCLLILCSLKLLRIHNPRLQALCLLLPFLKLIADLGSYQFWNWALAQGINPLNSPEGTRNIDAGIVFPPTSNHSPFSIILHLNQGETFSAADMLSLYFGPTWTFSLACLLITGTVGSLGIATYRYLNSHQWLKKLKSNSILYTEPFLDSFLQTMILRHRIPIYLTNVSHSPFITKQNGVTIFIPHSLFEQLSKGEFEAIIAHEIAHFLHGDLLINNLIFWIAHLFWWIPTQFYKKRLELAQEYACDRLNGLKIQSDYLTEALYKTSIWLKRRSLFPLAQSYAASHHVVKRLNHLLLPKTHESHLTKWTKITLLLCWIALLAFSKLWTF